MRSYQYVGFKDKAAVDDWLKKNCARVPAETCPHCKKTTSYKLRVIKETHEELFYNSGPTLRTYQLKRKGSGTVSEIVQADPWSSGPMAFLCLELSNGKRLFEWTNEEIDKYL